MKCQKQPKFLSGKPDKIAELWEVRLPESLWKRLVCIARSNCITYSTVTRYCAFRLAERSTLRQNRCLKMMKQADLQTYKTEKSHRHMVCLYGQDADLLRLAAMRLGVSVSCLIRLSLRLFLRHFDMESHSHRKPNHAVLFWYGIKRAFELITRVETCLKTFCSTIYYVQSFPPERRWNWGE